jgi:hypothetical protein
MESWVPARRWEKLETIAAICIAMVRGALPFATGSVNDAGSGLSIPRR